MEWWHFGWPKNALEVCYNRQTRWWFLWRLWRILRFRHARARISPTRSLAKRVHFGKLSESQWRLAYPPHGALARLHWGTKRLKRFNLALQHFHYCLSDGIPSQWFEELLIKPRGRWAVEAVRCQWPESPGYVDHPHRSWWKEQETSPSWTAGRWNGMTNSRKTAIPAEKIILLPSSRRWQKSQVHFFRQSFVLSVLFSQRNFFSLFRTRFCLCSAVDQVRCI